MGDVLTFLISQIAEGLFEWVAEHIHRRLGAMGCVIFALLPMSIMALALWLWLG